MFVQQRWIGIQSQLPVKVCVFCIGERARRLAPEGYLLVNAAPLQFDGEGDIIGVFFDDLL
ncbi:MAG: hypothetical protein BWY63_00673 [Chloroflexi bacterium ADurb.Bin360]|nr:MAG: hypothetical protein BWY63_00673 [Chloroflexi bacterium ADurb.Bin360]